MVSLDFLDSSMPCFSHNGMNYLNKKASLPEPCVDCWKTPVQKLISRNASEIHISQVHLKAWCLVMDSYTMLGSIETAKPISNGKYSLLNLEVPFQKVNNQSNAI